MPMFLTSKWFLIGAAALVLFVIVLIVLDNAGDQGEEIGRAEERAGRAEETIKRVEEAKDAKEEAEASGAAGDNLRFNQCVRSSRTPENCKRFLPQ